MASDHSLELPKNIELPKNLLFLDKEQLVSSFHFPKDIPLYSTKINSIDNPLIINYFLKEFQYWKSNIIKE